MDDEADDPTYGVPPIRETARRQTHLLHISDEIEKETALCESHQITSIRKGGQKIKVGDMVIVHNDVPKNSLEIGSSGETHYWFRWIY